MAITDKMLADDFQGTSPEGKRYTKSEEVADTSDLSKTARNCRVNRREGPSFRCRPRTRLDAADEPGADKWQVSFDLLTELKEVVSATKRSAKPLYVGSIPTRASSVSASKTGRRCRGRGVEYYDLIYICHLQHFFDMRGGACHS